MDEAAPDPRRDRDTPRAHSASTIDRADRVGGVARAARPAAAARRRAAPYCATVGPNTTRLRCCGRGRNPVTLSVRNACSVSGSNSPTTVACAVTRCSRRVRDRELGREVGRRTVRTAEQSRHAVAVERCRACGRVRRRPRVAATTRSAPDPRRLVGADVGRDADRRERAAHEAPTRSPAGSVGGARRRASGRSSGARRRAAAGPGPVARRATR